MKTRVIDEKYMINMNFHEDLIGWIMALQEHWKPEGTSLPQ